VIAYGQSVGNLTYESTGHRADHSRFIPADLQLFRSRTDVITLTLTATSGSLDPLLILTDDQGNPLAHSLGKGQPLTAAISSFSLGRDATYFVIVTRFGQDNG